MFDPKKPNNSLKKLPRDDFEFRDIDLLIELNKANETLWKLNMQIQKIPNPSILLEFTSIREWVKSNEIEAIHTTVWDALMSELVVDRAQITRENKETINYKEAIIYWMTQIKQKWWIWFNDILEINHIVTWNKAWIVSDPNKAIKKQNTWETLYTPPAWKELIKDLLYNFEEYYNNFDSETEIDPLLKLPLLHYQFEAIHPFWDWNWRVGRILIVLYLVLHNKLDLPILFLSESITESKTEYYDFLRKIDSWKENSLREFTLWLLDIIQVQAFKTSNTLSSIQVLMSDMKLTFKVDQELNKIYSHELMDYLFTNPFYSISKMARALKKHENTTSSYLKLLESKWVLKSFKHWKNKIYFFQEFFDLLK